MNCKNLLCVALLYCFYSMSPMSSFFPSAVMAYTDLSSLRGLEKPTDYGSGIEYADGVIQNLFSGYDVGLQIGLWLSGADGCDKINQGKMDGQIQKLVRYLEGSPASKIFLRIGYEFDNPSFGYSSNPGGYALAYRSIVDACRAELSIERRKKVYFVWHSWGAPTSHGAELDDFYPGDDYVDWVGVSIFQQLYPWAKPWDGSLSDVDSVMNFASQHEKPIMIAESTPFGGIDLNTSNTRLFRLEDPWDRWFRPVLDLIDRYDVSMWCYINCAWDQQPMWHGVGFGETRLSTSAKVMRKWKELVLDGGSDNWRDDMQHGARRKFLTVGSLGDCAGTDETSDQLSRDIVAVDSLFGSGEDATAIKASYSFQHMTESTKRIGAGVILAGGAMCIFGALLSLLWCRRAAAAHHSCRETKNNSRKVRFVDDVAVSEKTPIVQGREQQRNEIWLLVGG
mmetsp:Transcript_3811/g.10341  ORF Transcript_3811/g.10341 Transcript_3811/m.10341 type:complete len:452 (-) Transcript_3811:451-1806(-)